MNTKDYLQEFLKPMHYCKLYYQLAYLPAFDQYQYSFPILLRPCKHLQRQGSTRDEEQTTKHLSKSIQSIRKNLNKCIQQNLTINMAKIQGKMTVGANLSSSVRKLPLSSCWSMASCHIQRISLTTYLNLRNNAI